MPHFSPINWIVSGLIFYFVFMLFISVVWWAQNYTFSVKINVFSPNNKGTWIWS